MFNLYSAILNSTCCQHLILVIVLSIYATFSALIYCLKIWFTTIGCFNFVFRSFVFINSSKHSSLFQHMFLTFFRILVYAGNYNRVSNK